MTEYDYSPEAYERHLATQTRIAKWVNDTEQHRSEYQHAVPTKATPAYDPKSPPASHRKRPRPNLFINPPAPDSDTSDSDDYAAIPGPMPLSAPVMYPARHSPFYSAAISPVPTVGHHLLSPPVVVPQAYATGSQRSPHGYHTGSHYRSPSYVRSPQHSLAYYSVAPTPQVSPGYQYMYPSVAAGSAHPGYMVMPQQSPYQYKTMQPSVIVSNFLSVLEPNADLYFSSL
jgi:hypothetical protein